jgi:hypothetical protein
MYYPKSQIKTNLIANLGEFVLLDTKEPYQGPYWKTSSGQFFTGKNPNNTPVFELIPNPNLSTEIDYRFEGELNTTYSNLKQITQNDIPSIPVYYLNVPTSKDYDLGSYVRYFCKKANQNIYLEIEKETYDKLVNQDTSILFSNYVPFNLTWTIVGDSSEAVAEINKSLVYLKERNLKLTGLSQYFKNYSQFYQVG